MPETSLIAVRARAHDLADTGRFKRWDQIATKLYAEGFLPALIGQLGCDRLAVMMITRCCEQARA